MRTEAQKQQQREAAKRWRDKNPEISRGRSRAYYARKAEDRKAYQQQYRRENPDKIRVRNREYNARQRSENPQFLLREQLRSRIAHAVSAGKAGSAVRDLGCTVPELIEHLERQFAPGMSWDNRDDWHIDHRIPLALYDLSDREQFLVAAHFTNLQPKWADDNRKKQTKLEPPTLW